jgi:outer membrane protein
MKRDGELMSSSERTKLQREMASLESDYKLKAKALQEDQRRRGAEEEQKLVQKIRKAIQDVAKREGYDIVVDANAVLYASPKDDLSSKVISAVK